MKSAVFLFIASTAITACSALDPNVPKTLGELSTGYSYIPVDPLLVSVNLGNPAPDSAKEMAGRRYHACLARRAKDETKKEDDKNGNQKAISNADLMDALPDHTVRMAVQQLSGQAAGSFGPVGFGSENSAYRVVVDSGFTDTTIVQIDLSATQAGNPIQVRSLRPPIDPDVIFEARRAHADEAVAKDHEVIAFPVYVGVALRLTANLFVNKGKVDLALGALATKAEGQRVSGTLVMQTLGIYNQQVAATFGIPNELNQTSIQNALVSLGAIKAIVYDRDTGTRPRVTGIYNPLPTSDPRLMNAIYTALASEAVEWTPCLPA